MENDLVEDEYGYRARLITVDELIGKLGFWGNMSTISGSRFEASSSTPEWVFDTPYWTMSTENDWDHVWQVTESGYAIGEGIYYPTANVRPVINLSRDIYNNL